MCVGVGVDVLAVWAGQGDVGVVYSRENKWKHLGFTMFCPCASQAQKRVTGHVCNLCVTMRVYRNRVCVCACAHPFTPVCVLTLTTLCNVCVPRLRLERCQLQAL